MFLPFVAVRISAKGLIHIQLGGIFNSFPHLPCFGTKINIYKLCFIHLPHLMGSGLFRAVSLISVSTQGHRLSSLQGGWGALGGLFLEGTAWQEASSSLHRLHGSCREPWRALSLTGQFFCKRTVWREAHQLPFAGRVASEGGGVLLHAAQLHC